MSDKLLTLEELADMESGLTDGTIVYGRVLRRMISTLRTAWAERDALRAAAPRHTGWVPVSLTGEPCWYRAAYTYDDAWLALINGEYYESRQQAEGAGWRVVPCAALAGEEVSCEQS